MTVASFHSFLHMFSKFVIRILLYPINYQTKSHSVDFIVKAVKLIVKTKTCVGGKSLQILITILL